MPCRNPYRLYIPLAFVGPSSVVVWSELGPAPPFPPMGVLEVYWSWALSLVCEVALSVGWSVGAMCCYNFLPTTSFSFYQLSSIIFFIKKTSCVTMRLNDVLEMYFYTITGSITPYMVFSVTCVVVIMYLVFRHMLCYIDDQRLHHNCHLMTLGVQVHSLTSWHEHVQ